MKVKKIQEIFNKVKAWLKNPIQHQAQSLSRRYYVIENFFFSNKYSLDFNGLIPCSQLKVKSEFSKKNATAYQAYGSHYFKSLLGHAISMEKNQSTLLMLGVAKASNVSMHKNILTFIQ